MNQYKIAVIPGDGTGPEVVNEGLKVLQAASQKCNFKYETISYDFSGDPTRANQTANKIIVRPDTEIGEHRGFRDVQHAIGYGPRIWEYFVMIEIEAFTVKVTRDRDEVRDIISKIANGVVSTVSSVQGQANLKTADGKWSIIGPAERFIQGGGTEVKDAGRNRSIKATQRLVVGFKLRRQGGY